MNFLLTFEPLIFYISLCIIVILTVLVFKHNPKSATNIIFILLCLNFFIWLPTLHFVFLPNDFIFPDVIWVRMSMALVAIQNALLFIFAYTLPNMQFNLPKKYLWLLVLATIVMIVLSLSSYTFPGMLTTHPPQPQPGPGLIIFNIYNIPLIIGVLAILFIKLRRAAGIQKQQIFYVLLGISLFDVLTIITIALPILFFSKSYFTPLHSLYVLILLFMITYAIMRHRFLDIRVVLRKSLIIGSLLVISLAIVIVTLLIAKKIVGSYFSFSDDILVLVSMTILLLIFPRLKQSSQKLIDRYIFTDYVDLSAKIKEFAESIPRSTMMEELAEQTAKFIQTNIKIKDVQLFVYDHASKDRLVSYYPSDLNSILYISDPLIQFVQQAMNVIVKDELTSKVDLSDLEKTVVRRLETFHTQVAVPFGEQGQCYGMLLLGSKMDQKSLSTDELESLTKLARSLTHLVPQIATAEIVK